jgi:hypothetical protein
MFLLLIQICVTCIHYRVRYWFGIGVVLIMFVLFLAKYTGSWLFVPVAVCPRGYHWGAIAEKKSDFVNIFAVRLVMIVFVLSNLMGGQNLSLRLLFSISPIAVWSMRVTDAPVLNRPRHLPRNLRVLLSRCPRASHSLIGLN